MQFDLGPTGFGLLLVLSLGFGVVAQLVGTARTRWDWLVAAIAWFIGGLFLSEVLFGAATVDEIQPIIDGLAFDESLLGGLVVGIPVAIAMRILAGGGPFRRKTAA